MQDITLLNSTGYPKIDKILCGVVGLLETVFPERIRAYYVLGSYSDGTAVSLSDIDMTIIFKGEGTEEEISRVSKIGIHTTLLCPVYLDLTGIGEEKIFREGHRAKITSLFVFGEDIRDKIPLTPLDKYVRYFMHGLNFYIVRLARNKDTIAFPLNYPDPSAEFYGYDYNPVEKKNDTKLVMAIIGVISTALLGLKAGQYVGTKRECVQKYKEYIGDEWTELLEEVYEICRNQWGYLIPEKREDRERLRNICQRTLAIENHFLGIYRDFLLTELADKDESNQLRAAKRLGEVIYADKEVLDALKSLEGSANGELKKAVQEAIYSVEKAINS